MSLREHALDLLRTHSPYGVSLENHCLRISAFACAIARNESIAADEDLLFAIGYLHDIGLCVREPADKNYLHRGARFARPHAEQWGLDEATRQDFEDAMLYNHSLRKVPGIGIHAELIRRGVRVEHSLGRLSNGLSRQQIKSIMSQYPRGDFNRVLLDFFRITLREGGPVEIYRFFFPRRGTIR